MVELQRTKGAKELIVENSKDVVFKEPKDFTEIFKEFCFASLYIKEEVIKALQLIRLECNKINDMEIFNFKELPETMRIEEFKHIQDSSTSQILYHLRGTWVRELINIIRNEFSGVGKGWFNMKETSKITYDFGKLKKFLTVVRLMMQVCFSLANIKIIIVF
jgi:dynein heavy chain, axonemal